MTNYRLTPPPPNPRRKYRSGGNNALNKFQKLGYDPLDGMMNMLQRLQAEDDWWCGIRTGALVAVDARGNPRSYSSVAHSVVLAGITKIHADLMRYKYSRVSEKEEEQQAPKSTLVIKTSGRKDRIINGESEEVAMETDSERDINLEQAEADANDNAY